MEFNIRKGTEGLKFSNATEVTELHGFAQENLGTISCGLTVQLEVLKAQNYEGYEDLRIVGADVPVVFAEFMRRVAFGGGVVERVDTSTGIIELTLEPQVAEPLQLFEDARITRSRDNSLRLEPPVTGETDNPGQLRLVEVVSERAS